MEAEAEWHRLLAAVQHRGVDFEGPWHQAQLKPQQKAEGIARQGGLAVFEFKGNALAIFESCQLPWQLPGEAVLA